MTTIYKWDIATKLAFALHGMKARAADWVNTLGATEKATFDNLKYAMTKIFGDRHAPWQKYRELLSIKQ